MDVPVAAPPSTQVIAEAIEGLMMWSRRQARPGGLSATMFTTLDTLCFAGPLRISDLAVCEHLSQPGMTMLVNRLEADGLATRQPDPSDGRAALVAVTDEGRRRVAEFRTTRTTTIAAWLSEMSDADLHALTAAVPALSRLGTFNTANT